MVLPCHISVRTSLWAESGRQWSSRPDPTQTPSGRQRNQRVINVLLKMAHPSLWLIFVLMLKMISGGPALDQPFLCSLRLQWDKRIRSLGIFSLYYRSSIRQYFSVPYLQVTIRGRGGVVLAAPAPWLGPATPAGPVIQLFDGRGGALHCIEVPWKCMQTQTGLKAFNIWNVKNDYTSFSNCANDPKLYSQNQSYSIAVVWVYPSGVLELYPLQERQ